MRPRGPVLLVACVSVAMALGAVARSAPSRSALSVTAPKWHEAPGGLGVLITDLNGDTKPDLVTEESGLGASSVLLNSGNGRFGEANVYEVNVRALGDLNGDGRPDLVALDGETSTVSVLLNDGSGSFGASHNYKTALSPADVLIADLNGDGSADLATADEGGAATASLCSSTVAMGVFCPASQWRTGKRPGSIASSDVDGNGTTDLVVTNAGSSTVSVLLGRGDGSFQSHSDYATVQKLGRVSVAELNGDGKSDILTSNAAGTLSVLLNRGDGRFASRANYSAGEDFAIGDLDGDGKLDVATANHRRGTISVLGNRGDGSLVRKATFSTRAHPFSLEIADLNGDDRPDLTALEDSERVGARPTVTVLLSRGRGSFENRLEYAVGRLPNEQGVTPRALAAGDLNGDGRLDLAASGAYYNPLDEGVAIVVNRPGLCNVQRLSGMTVAKAKQTLGRVNCRVGKVRRAYSKSVERGHVLRQKPGFGAVLPAGGRVDVLVSRGRR
jgi:hypothetical protein